MQKRSGSFRLTPCTQGCCSTWLALRRLLASRTRSLDIRSLALEEMWAQSFSGNSYFPSWILSNKVFCGGEWENVFLSRWTDIWSSTRQFLKLYDSFMSQTLPGRCGMAPQTPSHSHHHSGLRMGGSHSTWCREWHQGSTGHSVCHKL